MTDNRNHVVLRECRFMMQSLGLLEAHSWIRKLLNLLCYCLLFTPQTMLFVTYVWFAYDQDFNLDKIVWILNLCVAIIQIKLIFFCFVANQRLTTQIMLGLQFIVDQRCNVSDESMRIFQKAEARNKGFCTCFLKLIVLVDASIFIPLILVFLSNILFDFPDAEYYRSPLTAKTFREDGDPLEFCINLFIQLPTATFYLTTFTTYSSCFIGLCIYLDALMEDFEGISLKLNGQINTYEVDQRDHTLTGKILAELVQLHNNTLSIMKSTKKLLSGPQFFQFLIFVFYIVLSIRSVEKSLESFGIEFIVCLDCILAQLVFLYVECHFATNITTKSVELANIAYNIRWYELPLTQQKMVSPIIRQGQIPFTLDGYKFFSCSLEAFAHLMRSSFSYYVVLRQLS